MDVELVRIEIVEKLDNGWAVKATFREKNHSLEIVSRLRMLVDYKNLPPNPRTITEIREELIRVAKDDLTLLSVSSMRGQLRDEGADFSGIERHIQTSQATTGS